MRLTRVLVAVLLAVTVQAALARYTVGGNWAFDLVLVGVVYAALLWGPVAGILSGTVGGLLQDLLAGAIVGVGGLAKTLVGFSAGWIGAQVVLARPAARTAVVIGATLVHRAIVVALMALIDQQWPDVAWQMVTTEVLIHAAVGLLAFQLSDAAPGLMQRGRLSRRSSLSRRRW